MPSKPGGNSEWDDQSGYHRKKWACDMCGEVSFDSYEEACQHESMCEGRRRDPNTDAMDSSMATSVTSTAGEGGNKVLAIVSDRNILNDLEYLLCRNVELFSANEEDIRDSALNDGSCGKATMVGQVGLRCVHCSRSPLATAGYATVFPGSVGSMGASLRMMAEWHFARCSMTPASIREGIERALNQTKKMQSQESGKEDEEVRALTEFCTNVVAKRMGVVNLCPAKTGIMFSRASPSPGGTGVATPTHHEERRLDNKVRDYTRAEPRKYSPSEYSYRQPQSEARTWYGAEESQHSQSSSYGQGRVSPPSLLYPQPQSYMVSSRHSQMVSKGGRGSTSPVISSNQRQSVVPAGMPSYHVPPVPHPYPPVMDRRMPPYTTSYPSRFDITHAFYRESMGWSCRHCSSVPFHYRAPNAFYPHMDPPPSSFIEQHLQMCSGANAYQPPMQHYHYYRGSYPSPQRETSINAALEYLTSTITNSPHSLVLDEDRLLLTDYFFFLIKQLQLCRFTESDRKTRGGKRENVRVGFGGLECRHCHVANPSNSRKFFWSNVDRLANSFAEIPSHVLKCRNCPDGIKNALQELKLRHPEQMAKLPRGSQKVFFRRMWRRVHIDAEEEKAEEESTTVPEKPTVAGIPLAIAEDKDWLSDTDCFVRRNLEVFCATEEDLTSAESDRKYPISLGQVGIRCIHCAASKEGASGNAVSFPYSIDGIYEVVRELQKLHFENCPKLPEEVKKEMGNLKTSTSLSSVLRRYYVLAAKALGMIDTPDGIRMGGETGAVGTVGSADLSSRKTDDDRESTESPLPLSGGIFKPDLHESKPESFQRQPESHQQHETYEPQSEPHQHYRPYQQHPELLQQHQPFQQQSESHHEPDSYQQHPRPPIVKQEPLEEETELSKKRKASSSGLDEEDTDSKRPAVDSDYGDIPSAKV